MTKALAALALSWIFASVASTHADWMQDSHWVESTTIADPWGDHLGRSVSIQGSTVLVGAPYRGADPFNPLGPGGAWLGTLSETGMPLPGTVITAADGEEGDLFGMQVLLTTLGSSPDAPTTALIAAPRRSGAAGEPRAGAVYTYRSGAHGDLVYASTLTPESQSANQMFGVSMACDGRTLVVGAPHDRTNAVAGGCVYVYSIQQDGSITGEQRLDPRHAYQEQLFGFSVAVDGDRIAVGAFADSEVQPVAGSVYIFERGDDSTWKQEHLVAPDELAPFDFFGTAVALRGGRLIATSNNRSIDGYANVGRAYVFDKVGDTWLQSQAIDPPILGHNVYWGASMCWEDDLLAIGANGFVDRGIRSGAVSVLRLSSDGVFEFQQTIAATDPVDDSGFGIATDIEDGWVVVGAPDLTLETGGAAFAFNETCIGDLDGDNLADVRDVITVVDQWNQSGISVADLNQDFMVDVSDLMIAAGSWGVCP